MALQQPQLRMVTASWVGLVLVAAALLLWRPAAAQQVGMIAGKDNPLPCTCTDVDVRVSFISVVEYTCWQQYTFGNCAQKFIMDSIKEVPEGYCQISCGRCPCCSSLAAAAEAAGLTEFWWAMNKTTGDRLGPLTAPGFAATLMAPDNNAMNSLFDKLGGKDRILSDDGVRGKLATIMAYHAVKPVPGYEAWTTPFLLPGTQLQTFKDGATLEVVEGGDGGNIKVQGAGSSAEITQKDIYACKGYINRLNWYLLPPGESLS